jgi:predicted oxidoreductase
MTWFRRGRETPPPPPPAEDEDSPDALRRRLWELVRFVNRNAGRLPVEAVVLSRQVTDRIREVIEISAERPLDVYAVVQINGIVGDYLPTTLRTFLALDPAVTGQPAPSGRTPREALREQLDALNDAADELFAAARSHDVDALFAQGNFLRTKFTGSDLDL